MSSVEQHFQSSLRNAPFRFTLQEGKGQSSAARHTMVTTRLFQNPGGTEMVGELRQNILLYCKNYFL